MQKHIFKHLMIGNIIGTIMLYSLLKYAINNKKAAEGCKMGRRLESLLDN